MSSDGVAERQASSYEQHNEVQEEFGLKMIARLELKQGMTVLDLGCGTGNLTKVLSERVGPEGRVVGVDPDNERLKIAREKYPASNIEYIEADDKTFPEGPYDLVFANAVMHWIRDKETLFERVYKSLKTGGQFAFVTFDGNPKVNKVVKRIFEELVAPDFFQKLFNTKMLCLNASEYETIALSIRYTIVFTKTEEYYEQWKNLDDCIDDFFSELPSGAFDPEKFDKQKLQEIKNEFGDGPVVCEEPDGILFMILAKPGSRI